MALSSTLHVQSTVLNDVNCSCECSAVLQIKCHYFKHVINTHLGKVSCIELAQHHREIIWLRQRENPVVCSGTPLSQKNTHPEHSLKCMSAIRSLFFQESPKQKYYRLSMPISDYGTDGQAKLLGIAEEVKAGCLLGILRAFWDSGYILWLLPSILF